MTYTQFRAAIDAANRSRRERCDAVQLSRSFAVAAIADHRPLPADPAFAAWIQIHAEADASIRQAHAAFHAASAV